jgi:hypothetical protein
MNTTLLRMALAAGILGLALGCGGGPAAQKVDPGRVANLKLEAMRQLADAIAKDPKSSEVLAAFDEFRNYPINANEHRKEADEILQIYQTRVQGKAPPAIADELAGLINGLRASLKGGK